MIKDREVLEQAAAAWMVDTHVELKQTGRVTRASVTYCDEAGQIESYSSESTTYGGSTQAHRVAHALRDLAFLIDLRNRE